jgi:serine/threonine-protein kinase
MTSLFGPFILVPGLAATNTLFQTMHADRSTRRIMLTLGLVAVVLPALLEVFGITTRSYDIAIDGIFVHPRMASFSTWPTSLVLFVSSVLVVLTPTLLVGGLRDALASAERRLFLHSWHLKQLVPDEAQRSGSGAPTRSSG